MESKAKLRTRYRRNIVVPDDMWKKLKALGKKEQRSMSSLIRESLQEMFKQREKKGYDPKTDTYTNP